jgi:AcrR family transcriptional regulator
MARPREFDEGEVLRAVRDQFWNAGYAATSLHDLMRVTGLGKGSLYAAFGDKHQLFLRVLRDYIEEGKGAARQLAAHPRALDGLRAFMMAMTSDPDEASARRGCFLANTTCELASADPAALAEARGSYESTTAALAECVVRAQHQGDMPSDADPMATARALLAAQQGIVFMGRTGLDRDSLVMTAQSLADQLLPDSR